MDAMPSSDNALSFADCFRPTATPTGDDTSGGERPWLVVVGASAGGLESLQNILPSLPFDLPIVVIVAVHALSLHRSVLADLLDRITPAPVVDAVDGDRVQSGRVYVAPAGMHLEIIDGAFLILPTSAHSGPKPSIDQILQSVAESHRERAIALILSGTGNDGSRGAQAVRAAGGAVFVQDPADARFDGMPSEVLRGGSVDGVAPASGLAALVAQRLLISKMPQTKDKGPSGVFDEILQVVRQASGFDIHAYKKSTVLRRIHRRRKARDCSELETYLAVLRHDPDEEGRLRKELRIPVTGFFRDPEVFEALSGPLEHVLEKAVAEDRELRIWSVGCASGEEAYSLVLLVKAVSSRLKLDIRLRVIATDIDTEALALARRGIYPAESRSCVPQAWHSDELMGEENGPLVIGQSLRDLVLFSEHDLLKDPPFLNIDLLVCRNLLIYLQPDWQQWCLSRLTQSVLPGGLMLLGQSEDIPPPPGLERLQANSVQALYRRSTQNVAMSPQDRPGKLAPCYRIAPAKQTPPIAYATELLQMAHQKGAYGPAIIASEDGFLLHSFGDLSGTLQFNRGGPASLNLAELAPPVLWLALRALIVSARAKPGYLHHSRVQLPGQTESVTLVAMTRLGRPEVLVLFKDRLSEVSLQRHLEEQESPETSMVNVEAMPVLLEQLDVAQEELRFLSEQYRSNLQELQGANEELETSNEELQSTNEELLAVNELLQQRTSELTRLNDDIQNVKNSLVDPLMVVDREGQVLMHNPMAEQLFLFGMTSAPRSSKLSLERLPSRPPMAVILEALREVIGSGEPKDIMLDAEHDFGGRCFNVRLQPYRNHMGECRGAVLLFQDITALRQLQEQLKSTAQRLATEAAFRRATVDALPDAICMLDDQGVIAGINLGWARNLTACGVPDLASANIGGHYLRVCEDAAQSGDPLAQSFLRGLNSVRNRTDDIFEQEYPCQRMDQKHWFLVTVSVLGGTRSGVVIRHQDVTQLHNQREDLILQARALDCVGRGVVICDALQPRMPIVYVNEGFESLTGYAASEALGQSCSFLQGSDRHQPSLPALRQALSQRENVRALLRNYRRNGDMFWNELSISMIAGEGGVITHVVGIQRDVTALLATEEALRQSLDREAKAMAFAGLGTLDLRLRDGQLVLSPQQHKLFALPERQDTLFWADLRVRVHPEDLPLLDDAIKVCVAGHAKLDVEFRIKDGESGWRWLHMLGNVERGADEGAVRIVAISQDTTDRRAAEERAAHISQHDALTGLPNRSLLRDRVQMAMRGAARSHSQLALMFIDLDRFKEVNDSLGHESGDSLLCIMADRLRSSVRATDTICRFGGDEFVVLLPQVSDSDEAAHVASKLLKSLQQPVKLGTHELRVSASVGVSMYPTDGSDADALLRHADAAMYRAKGSGRNAVRFFAKNTDDQSLRIMTMRSEMVRAVEEDALRLHFQPQLSFVTGQLSGFEALLRWQHPERGLLTPEHFLGAMEDGAIMETIGLWVLRETCKQVVAWRDTAAGGVPIAINVNPLQLRDGNFVRVLHEVCGASGVRPKEIEIEITERAILHDADAAARALADIRALGVGIALDDFGTGYSSLSHLHMHPISKLKIDRSFCAPLPSDRSAIAIVRAIIQMAQSLNIETVAEGVEHVSQAEFLRHEGCEVVQGYLFALPMPAEQILPWLSQSRTSEIAQWLIPAEH